jgi:hypothetical protein
MARKKSNENPSVNQDETDMEGEGKSIELRDPRIKDRESWKSSREVEEEDDDVEIFP